MNCGERPSVTVTRDKGHAASIRQGMRRENKKWFYFLSPSQLAVVGSVSSLHEGIATDCKDEEEIITWQ